jgi:Asp/Glu/hydantoin racemase
MQLKCSFVWPSNHKVCGGEVVSCTEFPLAGDDDVNMWHLLYGSKMLEKARANPNKAICLGCGELYQLQENLPLQLTE